MQRRAGITVGMHSPSDAAGNRPATANSQRVPNPERSRRPLSVPPGKLRAVRSTRGSQHKPVYSLDDADECDSAGRDPTLLEKDEGTAGEREAPQWITTRNSGGVVRARLTRSYAAHVIGRYAGRDRDCGFRSPYGVDYLPVGGPVSTVSGEVIRDRISGGWRSTVRAQTSAEMPRKTALQLDTTVEFKVHNYGFSYFVLDLSERPLEHTPKRSLSITFHVLSGEGVAYAAMEQEHAYPSDQKYTWRWDLKPAQTHQQHQLAHKSTMTVTIKPSDVAYAAVRKKKVVIAVRSETGDLQYRVKAATASFFAGMFQNFGGSKEEKRLEQQANANKRKEILDCISHSFTRSRVAKGGNIPPGVNNTRQRAISTIAHDRRSPAMSPTAQSRLQMTEESLFRKKKSFAATLDSTISDWVSDPDKFMRQVSQGEATDKANCDQGGNSEGNAHPTEPNASKGSARSGKDNASRIFEVGDRIRGSAVVTVSSSATGTLRGKSRLADEDMQALDRGDWSKVVLKARVPDAVKLEWAVQELEVSRGMRNGETGAKRYVKLTPKDERKQDQSKNMSEVRVKTCDSVWTGPILTQNVLEHMHGKHSWNDEFTVKQSEGLAKIVQDTASPQTRVPHLKLGKLDQGSGVDASPVKIAVRHEHGANTCAEGPQHDARENMMPDTATIKPDTLMNGLNEEAAAGSEILTSRSTGSSSDTEEELFSDEKKLMASLFETHQARFDTEYSKTDAFLDKLADGQPVAEVGVNLPGLIQLLSDMNVISTSKSSVIGKRDVSAIVREIFAERAVDHKPTDDEIVLNFIEFKKALSMISSFLGKPFYSDGLRPNGVDEILWMHLQEDINPTSRLKRMSLQGNFRKLMIKAFGRYNKKSDGKLLRDEFIDLCHSELGFSRPQALGLLEPAGIHHNIKSFDLHTFASIFAAEEDVKDARDTDEARSKSLDLHYMLHNFNTMVGSVSTDTLRDNLAHVENLQRKVRKVAATRSKDIEKTGWIYRQEEAGAAKLWRLYYAIIESHTGGSVIRLFHCPVKHLGTSKAELEALGQVDEMWVDGGDKCVEIIPVDDNRRQMAREIESASGQNYARLRSDSISRLVEMRGKVHEDPDDDEQGQCIIKVYCKSLERDCPQQQVFFKVRGTLAEDEAHDWAQAIRQGVPKRQLWASDMLKDSQQVAHALDSLHAACASTKGLSAELAGTSEAELDALLVKDIAASLLQGLRPSSLIQPTVDKDGFVCLAQSLVECNGANVDKKNEPAMASIKEETYSAMRAFLTPRARDNDRSSSPATSETLKRADNWLK